MRNILILTLVLGLNFSSCKKEDISGDTGVLTTITSVSEYDSHIAEGVSLVFFHATWCSKCAEQRPAIEGLTKDAELNSVHFGQVDYEKSTGVIEKADVTGFPVILMMKDGVEKQRINGTGNSQASLKEKLKALF